MWSYLDLMFNLTVFEENKTRSEGNAKKDTWFYLNLIFNLVIF